MKSSLILTASSILLFGAGGALLFAPTELAPDTPILMTQLLAGALVGFGAMNWMARSSSIGGIYGRAIVVGNLGMFTIGALSAIRVFFDERSTSSAVIAAAALLFAVLFAILLTRGTPR